jgi:hypothetical protein
MTIQEQKEQIESKFAGDDSPWTPEVEWDEGYNRFEVTLKAKKLSLEINLLLRFNSSGAIEVDTCNDDCWHAAHFYIQELILRLVMDEWETENSEKRAFTLRNQQLAIQNQEYCNVIEALKRERDGAKLLIEDLSKSNKLFGEKLLTEIINENSHSLIDV